MDIKVEVSQSQIGKDNLILDDIMNKNLGVRLIFAYEDGINRTETVLKFEEAVELNTKICKALKGIEDCYYTFFNSLKDIPEQTIDGCKQFR
jgi:hypothetical protein